MHRRLLVLLGVLGLALIVSCGPSATPAPTSAPAATTGAVQPAPTAIPTTAAPSAKKTVLRLPETAKLPQTIDPAITSGGGGLEEVQNFFEGLIYVDQVTGELKPGQAEKWGISPDGITYTFNLRANLKWSD